MSASVKSGHHLTRSCTASNLDLSMARVAVVTVGTAQNAVVKLSTVVMWMPGTILEVGMKGVLWI